MAGGAARVVGEGFAGRECWGWGWWLWLGSNFPVMGLKDREARKAGWMGMFGIEFVVVVVYWDCDWDCDSEE